MSRDSSIKLKDPRYIDQKQHAPPLLTNPLLINIKVPKADMQENNVERQIMQPYSVEPYTATNVLP